MASSPAAAPGPAPAGPPPATLPPLTGSQRLTGANRVASVRVLEWTAGGFTKVVGDVEVGTGTVSGSLAVGGKVVARQLALSGDSRIDGELRVTDRLRSRGNLRVAADVVAGVAELTGSADFGKSLTVTGTLDWSGSLDVRQDVHAESVLFRGRLAVGGVLAARTISGAVEGRSSVSEIRADWVEIRSPRSLRNTPVFFLPPPTWHELEAGRIEAREVHLSGVRVHYLKADRIWLGPDAHVEYVDGSIVERHKDAHVGPESESPPPQGLSR